MAPQYIINYAAELCVDSSRLNNAVRELYEKRAEIINNRGSRSQLNELVDEYGINKVKQMLLDLSQS